MTPRLDTGLYVVSPIRGWHQDGHVQWPSVDVTAIWQLFSSKPGTLHQVSTQLGQSMCCELTNVMLLLGSGPLL